MAENETTLAKTLRHLLSLPALSLLVASLSLASSISQNYNYRRSIETVQANVLRTENLKTCREVIEVFFAYRLRAEEANLRGSLRGEEADQARRELKSLTARFGAIATHLANFTPEAMRERYTTLYRRLDSLAETAPALAKPDFTRSLTEADAAFGALNDDCVKSAQFARI